MNYRHDFHAGNFADVFKHAILTRILLYLTRKPAPFRFLDTHAGSGRYDLGGAEAACTGEWRDGVGRVDPAAMSEPARALLAPYWALVGSAARGAAPYPGSPALALALLRPGDRMLFCDLHPAALGALKRCIGRDRRAKAVSLDGYAGLHAFLPPVERRGLVLVDPPFEAEGEFAAMAEALVAAWRKWREGVFVAWYPVKDRRGPELLAARLREAGAPTLRLELHVAPPAVDGRLAANGLLVLNPPFVLQAEASCLLPELARQLGSGRGSARIGWLDSNETRNAG